MKLMFLPFLALTAGAAAVLLGMTHAAPGHSSDWQTHKDARRGFAVARPTGWTVQGSPQTIRVRSPDRSEIVLAEAFTAVPGEAGGEHLAWLQEKGSVLFPRGRVSHVTAQPSKGNEVAAALSYQTALAAPGTKHAAARPTLTRIVKSLRFTAPTGGGGAGVTDGGGTSYSVQGGSKHYYKNPRTGTILGTDSAYSPGVDFTPLTER